MYEFVNDTEIKPYRSYCSEILADLRDLLLEEYEINTQFILVGSGARNMVMRDGSGPFDLDYNLVIINMPNKFWNDLGKLKNTVISSLNRIVGRSLFSDGHDSTSVISAYIYTTINHPSFNVDIAILGKNQQGTYCRLIHDKYNCTYTWCQVPSSKKVGSKVKEIKAQGRWNEVRDAYLRLKNLYLSRGDRDHPSFVVYVEAVQQVYQKIQSKKSQTQKQSKQQNKNKTQPQKKTRKK